DSDGGERRGPRLRPDKSPTRILNDSAIAEIAQIPGVAYVEPSIGFPVFVRANGHVQTQFVGGATIPNASSRFKEFHGGQMISAPEADEAVVNERFTREFGFAKPADAVNQTIEFLAPKEDGGKAKPAKKEDAGPTSFF